MSEVALVPDSEGFTIKVKSTLMDGGRWCYTGLFQEACEEATVEIEVENKEASGDEVISKLSESRW